MKTIDVTTLWKRFGRLEMTGMRVISAEQLKGETCKYWKGDTINRLFCEDGCDKCYFNEVSNQEKIIIYDAKPSGILGIKLQEAFRKKYK